MFTVSWTDACSAVIVVQIALLVMAMWQFCRLQHAETWQLKTGLPVTWGCNTIH
jgi:hypothetical protein